MSSIIVIPNLLDELPFQILTWERFQTLCTDILSRRQDVTDCREYLKQGNEQQGIDVYAFDKEGARMVAQCKKENYLSPGDVAALVNEFIAGVFADSTTEFILCTSFDLSKHRDENTTIATARNQLATKKITLLVWDHKGLSQHLRNFPLPEIVYHYFGKEVAMAFYGEIWTKYISKLQDIPKQQYPNTADHIARSIVLHTEHYHRKKTSNWYLPKKEPLRSLVTALESNETSNHIVLLGVAGFGKTEEVKTAAAYFAADSSPIHPVRYFLKDYEGQPIESLLENHQPLWCNISTATLLLLFDGLDETKENHYQTFINHLNAFTENHPEAKIVVSSRFNFYDLLQQPLRQFDIYVLQPLSHVNIDQYLEQKLGQRKVVFVKTVRDSKFAEYADNPYYLTRLVRFFDEPGTDFPRNKSELFQRILFEQMDKDKVTYHKPELKEILYPLAQKVAFCMTLSGKSLLTNEDLKLILPVDDHRKNMRHFCILNYNEQESGSWAFEHKNMQEYLCATFLESYNFTQILPLISFSFNREKLLPRFLNTISFLFELLDNNCEYFQQLFKWLQASQAELFVRFEKEQISKETRLQLFKSILDYYQCRNLTIQVSSNFSVNELAEFIEIDEPLIDYLGDQLTRPIDGDLAYDMLQILSMCKRQYLYEAKLLSIYYEVLRSTHYAPFVKGQCIYSMAAVNKDNPSIFEIILTSGIDLSDFDVRRRLVSFLEFTSYYETFLPFVLESIKIYVDEQQVNRIGGADDALIRILLVCKQPQSILKILDYLSLHPGLISERFSVSGVRVSEKDLEILFANALIALSSQPRILPAVFRLFLKTDAVFHHDKIFACFSDFFARSCGHTVIFKKIYRYDIKRHELFHFADTGCLNIIISDYKTGKFDDNQMYVFRNQLSHIRPELIDCFILKLQVEGFPQFVVEPDTTNYLELYEKYKVRNQILLFDKAEFFKEAASIFKQISITEIGFHDLYETARFKGLRNYQNSIVKDEIGKFCHGNSSINKEVFLNIYQDETTWLNYSLTGILEYLKNNQNPPLLPEIEAYAKEWLTNRISKIRFTQSVVDNGSGVSLFHDVEFVKELYMKLEIELADDLLIPMLQSDYSGIHTQDSLSGISSKVINKIKNKSLVKPAILANIKSGTLASWVLITHFRICKEFHYQEALPDLFKAITSNPSIDEHEKKYLSQYYFDLGGEPSDFLPFLSVPQLTKELLQWNSWNWYLLELFAETECKKVGAILVTICNDPQRNKNEVITAVKLLLQSGHKQGLEFWAVYIRKNNTLPFELQEGKPLETFLQKSGDANAIDTLIDVLEYAYENNLVSSSSFDSIPECVYYCLIQLGSKNRELYTAIMVHKERLQKKYATDSLVKNIEFFAERLAQRFYECNEYIISVDSALSSYDAMLNSSTLRLQ
ncbi:MAG: hypothetical protein Q8K64_07625 [Sediminibacterium sp.]|nr:hypothetical protein [Sediminibacterium sp.]